MAGRVDPSRIGELTGKRDVAVKINFGNIRRTVEAVDLFERNSLEIGFTLTVTLQRWVQNLLFPPFFGLVFGRGFFDLLHRPDSLTKGGAVAVTDKIIDSLDIS